MSLGGGSPILHSLVQSAQQQQQAAKARDRERAAQDRPGRTDERRERRVDEVELDAAVRAVPENDSEQAEQEHHSRDPAPPHQDDEDEDRPRIDLTA